MLHSGPAPDFLAILEVLARHKVKFVLVGGVAAAMQGAPVNTYDIDIVQCRESSNIDRLLEALRELQAVYRMQPERRLAPNASHLSSGGHSNLITKYGPLDVLGTIGRGHSWDELIESTDILHLSDVLAVAVLDLPTQIVIKEEVGGQKDLHALPILRRTLLERTT